MKPGKQFTKDLPSKVGVIFDPNYEAWETAVDKAESALVMGFKPTTMELSNEQSLHTGQDTVDTDTLSTYSNTKSDKKPIVVTHRGKMWIHDGHHRIVSSRARGDKSLTVDHLNLDTLGIRWSN